MGKNKKTSVIQNYFRFILIALALILFVISTSISIAMEIELRGIYGDAQSKYLEQTIDHLNDTTNQFILSFDTTLGQSKVSLNTTSQFISRKYFSEKGSELYTNTNYTMNGEDSIVYINASVDMQIDRMSNIGYYDFNNDGLNDLHTPGGLIYSDVLNNLTISGEFYLQINASIEGQLSDGASIAIYAVKNANKTVIDITEEYNIHFNDTFNNKWIIEWNKNNSKIIESIRDKLEGVDYDYLETYVLLRSPSHDSIITLHQNSALSRFEGCINGTIRGTLSGVLHAKFNGTMDGFVDLRPHELYQFLIASKSDLVQWVYFATPAYFLIFPYAPNYQVYTQPSTAGGSDYQWEERAWYNQIIEQEAKQNNTGSTSHFSSIGVDYTNRNLFISLGQVIYNFENTFQGILVLDFNLDYISNVLELSITEEDYSMFTDSTGEILLAPEYFFNTSRQPKEEFPSQNIKDIDNEQMQNAVDDALNGKEGHIIIELNGTEYLLLYKPIKSINWFFFHFTPIELLEAEFQPLLTALRTQMREIELALLLISFGVIGVTGITLLLVNKRTKKYIEMFLKNIRTVSKGDFSVSFDGNELSKMNELTELFYEFENMAIRLEKSLQEEQNARFLANLSLDLFTHDLGNYHQAIQGYLELLLLDETIGEQQKKLIQNTLRVLLKAELLRHSVKQVINLDEMNPKTQVKWVDIINDALDALKYSYSEYTIDVKLLFDKAKEINGNKYLVDIVTYLFEYIITKSDQYSIGFVINIEDKRMIGRYYHIVTIDSLGIKIPESEKEEIRKVEEGRRVKGLRFILIHLFIKAYGGTFHIEDIQEGTRFIFSVRDY